MMINCDIGFQVLIEQNESYDVFETVGAFTDGSELEKKHLIKKLKILQLRKKVYDLRIRLVNDKIIFCYLEKRSYPEKSYLLTKDKLFYKRLKKGLNTLLKIYGGIITMELLSIGVENHYQIIWQIGQNIDEKKIYKILDKSHTFNDFYYNSNNHTLIMNVYY